MKKNLYSTPETERLEVFAYGNFLIGSASAAFEGSDLSDPYDYNNPNWPTE